LPSGFRYVTSRFAAAAPHVYGWKELPYTPALTITPNAGGKAPAVASIVIQQLA
jgi:hypothetical protein